MIYMLCRTRTVDFARWKTVFDSHAEAHRNAGLRLVRLWRSVEEPDNVFFLFEADSIDRARQFIDAPASAQAGEDAGVIDGEYHFVEEAPGY